MSSHTTPGLGERQLSPSLSSNFSLATTVLPRTPELRVLIKCSTSHQTCERPSSSFRAVTQLTQRTTTVANMTTMMSERTAVGEIFAAVPARKSVTATRIAHCTRGNVKFVPRHQSDGNHVYACQHEHARRHNFRTTSTRDTAMMNESEKNLAVLIGAPILNGIRGFSVSTTTLMR